ncbi:hypothetical protein JTE90_004010 [Oedothorax gibbosus]|uniref:Uncharacterized protein n=1 Tax=Oedothorax gibbosus TaxID=931172 RepID=A0AAV6U5H7_9ARAC|nr:hypothetical protein JTE90_004010 [Oedothorax gibbosus]
MAALTSVRPLFSLCGPELGHRWLMVGPVQDPPDAADKSTAPPRWPGPHRASVGPDWLHTTTCLMLTLAAAQPRLPALLPLPLLGGGRIYSNAGPAFAVRIHTENQDQASFCPFAQREVSVLAELALGHLRYLLTDVPLQPNNPPESVLGAYRALQGGSALGARSVILTGRFPLNRVSKETMKAVVFH